MKRMIMIAALALIATPAAANQNYENIKNFNTCVKEYYAEKKAFNKLHARLDALPVEEANLNEFNEGLAELKAIRNKMIFKADECDALAEKLNPNG